MQPLLFCARPALLRMPCRSRTASTISTPSQPSTSASTHHGAWVTKPLSSHTPAAMGWATPCPTCYSTFCFNSFQRWWWCRRWLGWATSARVNNLAPGVESAVERAGKAARGSIRGDSLKISIVTIGRKKWRLAKPGKATPPCRDSPIAGRSL